MINLKKVLSLHSEVININKLTKGEFVGYDAKHIASDNELIAVIAIGHADGVTICMDYIMVKVDNTVKVHDKVDLICDELAIGKDIYDDSPHHLLVSITNRVPRIYKE